MEGSEVPSPHPKVCWVRPRGSKHHLPSFRGFEQPDNSISGWFRLGRSWQCLRGDGAIPWNGAGTRGCKQDSELRCSVWVGSDWHPVSDVNVQTVREILIQMNLLKSAPAVSLAWIVFPLLFWTCVGAPTAPVLAHPWPLTAGDDPARPFTARSPCPLLIFGLHLWMLPRFSAFLSTGSPSIPNSTFWTIPGLLLWLFMGTLDVAWLGHSSCQPTSCWSLNGTEGLFNLNPQFPFSSETSGGPL